jgi:hypothetical protein
MVRILFGMVLGVILGMLLCDALMRCEGGEVGS